MGLRRRTPWMFVLLVLALLVPMATARADAPVWSGLDARFYAGSIPPQGGNYSGLPRALGCYIEIITAQFESPPLPRKLHESVKTLYNT